MKLLQPANTVKYDVKSSDTLSSIALRYNTTPSELSRLNHLPTTLLYPGQTLFVPDKSDELKEKDSEVKVQITDSGKPHARITTQESNTVPPPYRTMSPTKMSLSPDHSLEDLLNRQNSEEEVSRRYLKIKCKYITDGQGVVSGVLLVTPQTIMFNPSVSDHLVIDRGRDYYVVRLPLRALSMVTLFEDIAAMVVGDISKQYIPPTSLRYQTFSPPKPGVIVCQETGEEYRLKDPNLNKDHTKPSNRRSESLCTINENTDPKDTESSIVNYKSNESTIDNDCLGTNPDTKLLSSSSSTDDDTVESNARDSVPCEDVANSDCKNELVETIECNQPECSEKLDGDNEYKEIAIVSNALTVVGAAASSTDEISVDSSSGDTVTRSSISTDVRIDSSDSTKRLCGSATDTIDPVHSPNVDDEAESHANNTDNSFFASPEHASSSTPKHSYVDGAFDCKTTSTELPEAELPSPSDGCSINIKATKKHMNLDLTKTLSSPDSESLPSNVTRSYITSKPQNYSQDSSIVNHSERNYKSRALHAPVFDSSKDSGFSEMTRSQHSIDEGDLHTHSYDHHLPSASRASLNEEAKKWLGNHGVVSTSATSSPLSPQSDREVTSPDIVPRPASEFQDPLMYIAINVSKRYWCPAIAKQNSIMGIPPNRDQKRRQHWFAVPRERIDQFYGFVLHWLPDLHSRVSTPSPECEYPEPEEGLQIVDDTFSNSPASTFGWEKLNSDDAAGMQKLRVGSVASSKTSLRSFDDEPEMSSDSLLLTKDQMKQLSRKLPSRTVGRYMELVYSTMTHGISLNTLYRNFNAFDCPVLLIVTDRNSRKFGAFLSDPPMVSEGYYGTGECMVFTFLDDKTLGVYNWSGENSFFIKGSKTGFSIGGGSEGVLAIWLDEDLYHGRSHSCKTFNNDTLSSNEDFICGQVEAWAFI